MMYRSEFDTGLIGRLTLLSDGEALTACYFEHDRFGNACRVLDVPRCDDIAVLGQARDWLERYFAGLRPAPEELPLALEGSGFQQQVWRLLLQIPYGSTCSYGDIAREIECSSQGRMSAQAVGAAVGRNPLCIIIPCHRVLGAGGKLTGFGGGLDVKSALLLHEGIRDFR